MTSRDPSDTGSVVDAEAVGSDDRHGTVAGHDHEVPERPDRPTPVTVASAILIVSGGFGIVAALAFVRSLPAGAEPVFISTVLIGAASILLGALVRQGRAWALAITFAAALGFLDLINGPSSIVALVLGLSDILVVGLLLAHRAWFDAVSAWRAALRADERAPTAS